MPAMPSSQHRAMPLPALPPTPQPPAPASMPHPGPPRPADANEAMPTLPRQLPPVASRGSPGAAARPGRQVPHFQAPGRGSSHARKRSLLQPWMVIVAIILAAAVAGVIVAMSGPNVAVQRGK
jgi:hypothetical protein